MGSDAFETIEKTFNTLGINYTVYTVRMLINIVAIVARWMLFKKFNEGGWKAIIPFYNYYEYGKLSGKKGWALTGCISQALCVLAVPLMFVIALTRFRYEPFDIAVSILYLILVMAITGILNLVSRIIVMISFGKFYEHRDLVTVLMIIVKPIAEILLGFSNAFKFKAVQQNYYYNAENQNPYQNPAQNQYQNTYQNPYQGTNQNPYQGANQNPYQNSYQNPNQGTAQNPYQGTAQNTYQGTAQNAYQNPYQAPNQNAYQNVPPVPNQNMFPNSYQNPNLNSYQDMGQNPSLNSYQDMSQNQNPDQGQ